jgi:phasin family protein
MAKRAFPDAFADFTKMMKGYQVPGVDWQELIAAQQKNVEALTRANQVLLEGAQAVVQREVELLQQAMQELAEASRGLMQEGDPQAHAQRRLELAKTSFETALRNMRELAEMAGRANREALEMINQRALESFEEIRTAVTQERDSGAQKRETGAGRS